MLPKFKKIILTATLIIFVSAGLFVAIPQPARAQFVVETPSLTAWEVVKSVGTKILASVMQSGVVALMNAAQSFTQKIAYDMAVYVASGGSGQKPLFDGKSFSDYVRDTALDGAMTFITNFSDSTLGKYGFNVCAPSLSLIGKIRLGALEQMEIASSKPRCDFNAFTKSWDQFGSSLGNGTVLKNFGIMFEPGNSELEFAFEFNSKLVADTQNKLSQSIAERTSSGGWKDVKNFINGRVTTPNAIVKDTFSKATAEDPYAKAYQTVQLTGQALGQGAYAILPTMLSTFTNTLLNQTMKKVMTGLFPGELFGDDTQNNIGDAGSAGSPISSAIGRRLAEQVYSDFIKPRITTASNYDPLLEFTSCPTNEEEKQMNNCVLDDGFAAAVRQADQGRPITITEALDQGYLDGNRPLISSKDARNEQKNCYEQGYCYSNLVKLRKARILPVGFELAAEVTTGNVAAVQGSGGSANNLRAVVNSFNDCNSIGARDSSHPYCHMIDPNWVLRLPKMQCNATVYGPTLASTAGAFRAQTCADPMSCLSQDENGNCIGGYGYCTKEKNIWRISADTCQEQFNTCLSYQSRDKKQYNYLQNTTDFGSCSSENVGCRAYSKNQVGNEWSLAPGNAVYLNQAVEKCDAKNAGCTELYSKKNGLAYNLLPNPSFEKSPGTPGWSGSVNLQISTDGRNSFDGQNAINPVGNLLMTSPSVIKLAPNTAYAFSGYVKSSLAGTTKYRLAIFLYTDPAAGSLSQFNPANIISTCKIGTDKAMEISGEVPASYTRVSCAFLTPGATLYARPLLGGNSWVDAVQLEEGSEATAFLSSGYGVVASAFIKVAPDYLDCGAGSTDSRCAGYAPTCKAEEVGCERYTPKDGSPAVSGSVSVNDICPANCSGYETFRQEKTIYETEKFPVYLIPSTAKTCASQDVGCDEFTNLATEAKEYFSDIRQCIKLDPKDWDAFYTWEGSDQTGYQLRAHRLKIGTVQVGEVGPVPAIIDNNYAACTKIIFTAPFADPKHNSDCREFYNAAGQVSYRLLSKTIIATDECIDYRKTDSNLADCAGSGGAWNITAQYCLYHGYKAESRVCPPAANQCRAYAGATSANLRFVFQDDFEAGSGNWSGGAVSSESLSAGGHSYKVGAGAGMSKGLAGQVFASQSYSISFWAKGNGGEVMQVAMSDAVHGASSAANFIITLKGDWQYYELGPINTNQTISATPMLQIRLTSGTGFYIDNITLKESGQKLYLIKNSWTTPAVCDQTLQNVLLPQAMLGCKEYTTRANESIYLKSFSSLCRDEAVGCAPFQNTYNSAKDFNEYYNLICSLPNTLGGGCQYNNETVCSIGVGASACRFNINNGTLAPASYQAFPIYSQSDYKDFNAFQAKLRTLSILPGTIFRDESTVETAADKAVYVVDDKKYYCQEKDAGCTALGQPELYKNAGASTVYFKNIPDNYSKILCTAEGEGCESWTSGKGVDYFKIPKGECEYKNASGGATGGWYKKGTDTACYLGFIKNGGYGIWRNADANFNGSAGLCPETQSGCTEFVDPLDTSAANVKGRPYYLIDNDKLKSLENDATCSGKVSLTEGCVLLNKTSDINKKWHSFATYFSAEQQKKLVAPVDKLSFCGIDPAVFGTTIDPFKPCATDIECPANLTPVFPGLTAPVYTGKCEKIAMDTNTILKVTRDRECSEWLSCKTSYAAYDPLTNKARTVCAEVGLCDKYQTTGTGSSICANFIAKNPDNGNVLNADYYSKRPVGWVSKDYSGFSLGNKYPITDIGVVNVGTAEDKDFRLKTTVQVPLLPFGFILENRNIDGTIFNKNQAEETTCRGYPEQDSPFPSSVAKYDTQGFKNANTCEDGENCECDYTKLTYSNKATIKYTSYENRSVSTGICQGGSRDGLSCKPGVSYENDPQSSCGKQEEGGTCLKLQRQDDVIGWSGYCLERDPATPINGNEGESACLTWWPQDIVPGGRDIYNQFRTAGYVPPLGGGKYYCLQAKGDYVSDAVTVNPENHYLGFLSTFSESRLPYPNSVWGVGCQGTNICGTGEGVCWGGKQINLSTSCTGNYIVITPWPATGSSGWPNYPSVTKTKSEIGVIPFSRRVFKVGDSVAGQPVTLIKVDDGNSTSLAGNVINKDDVDALEIKFLDSDYSENFPKGTSFFIENGRLEKNYMAGSALCDGTKVTDNCAGEAVGSNRIVKTAKARSTIEKNANGEYWYWRYDDGETPGKDFKTIDLFLGDETAFKTACYESLTATTDGNSQTAMQVRFHFSKTGLLDEVAVAHCEVSGKADTPWKMQILVRSREKCEQVIDVAASKNAALTNNLWAENIKNKNKDATITATSFEPSGLYHYDYEVQPFGSASADTAPINQKAWYSFYSMGTPSFAGVPWSCKGACGTAGVLKDGKYGSDGNPSTVDFDIAVKNNKISSKSGFDTAISFIRNLFARAFNSYQYVSTGGEFSYQEVPCPAYPGTQKGGCYDYRTNTSAYPNLKNPQIYSYNPSRILPNTQFGIGQSGIVNINNIFNQEIKINGNQYLAIMKFYAFADSNRMPITGVRVDWGDGSIFETTEGMYKNRKPLCANSDTEAAKVCANNNEIVCEADIDCPGSTCTSTAQIFGNIPEACEEGLFELQHIYTCAKSIGESCTFTPSVTVKDNWGINSSSATGSNIVLQL